MNILDIILALVLVWALISGLRKGLISQGTSLVGLILGIWLAIKFNDQLGEWIGVEVEGVAAYAILFAAAILLSWFGSKVSSLILNGIGLGFVDKIGGAILSVVLYTLALNLLIGAFRSVNSSLRIVEESQFEESLLLPPVERVSEFVFPYLIELKDAIVESDSFRHEGNDNTTDKSKNNKQI
ncbi:MAG: CvpA family protein [Tidjanibacter sp.]|nr:CvpA family protein [Tidjanibacter sp.]